MKVLKGFAVGFLTFLLFWSLSALGLAITAKVTILNPDFVIAQLDRGNLYGLAKQQIMDMVPTDPEVDRYLNPALNDTLTELEPSLKEQAREAIYTAYDYFKGRTGTLNITVSTDEFKSTLRENLWQEFQKSPPPEAAVLPPSQLRQYFDQNYDSFVAEIPSRFEITEGMFSPETRGYIETARDYISRFEAMFMGLIAITAILIIGVALIYREVKAGTRSIGITFATYGGLELIAIFVGRYFAFQYLPDLEPGGIALPAGFLQGVINDVMSPLIIFAAAILAAGVVLIVVSYIYPRRADSREKPAS